MLPPHLVYSDSPNHHHLDNCAFGGPTVYLTEALSGDLLMARMPVASKPLYGLE
jgi:gluconolactonase